VNVSQGERWPDARSATTGGKGSSLVVADGHAVEGINLSGEVEEFSFRSAR
jgi:hypothetical protein